MKNQNLLITGAAGFIGNNLAYKLLDIGYNIFCIDNFNKYYDLNLKILRKERLLNKSKNSESAVFHFEKLDLRDKEAVFKFIKDKNIEKVCHLAAQAGVRYSIEYPQTYVDNNITATINLLEACKENGVTDFIFASTSSVYGLSQEMPFNEETSIDSTISTYSSTKRACELLCHTYNNLYGIKFRILRFFTVYGPWGRPDMALFLFTKAINEGNPISVFNNGNMKRDFTYIDDIVNGFLLAIENTSSFEIFNLGSGKSVELIEYIEVLEKILGVEAKKIMEPMQPGDVRETLADISKSKKILNYEPKFDIEIGVQNFVEWYKKYYK